MVERYTRSTWRLWRFANVAKKCQSIRFGGGLKMGCQRTNDFEDLNDPWLALAAAVPAQAMWDLKSNEMLPALDALTWLLDCGPDWFDYMGIEISRKDYIAKVMR